MNRGLLICLRGKDLLRIQHKIIRHYNCEAESEIKRFIAENTEIVRDQSLTPEISLRLFTVKCRFWTERPELWPFPDPFWAIYWPGGQALARHLLNNPELSAGRKVLDLGCGCGASAIAAKLSGAAHVVANDTDPVAAIATKMNCELNGLEPFPCVTENLIESEPENWDLILLGDMFYEESLIDSLHNWLNKCVKLQRTQVLIGDPGRAQFESHEIKKLLYEQAQFDLPDSVREENYGLTKSTVWSYRPEN
ncbi:electron transfer flavoprotein beta subunit lysine methyltransferase [Silurus asotus]|uniref:Electron transfer flavoprotein beta subunit lysine methyltransferase n=1 Tax=Silurus asotus TaxID=30991 RepID=A0AAD5FT46_SILAS|nr:electron transfer flavoprotein beta subunit lysine methyltransferase [Silurus asotus]